MHSFNLFSIGRWLSLNGCAERLSRKWNPYNSSSFLVIFCLQKSFLSVQAWVKELNQLGPKNIIIAIAGNKCDRAVEREVIGFSS